MADKIIDVGETLELTYSVSDDTNHIEQILDININNTNNTQ
jgi:hypothetical protein